MNKELALRIRENKGRQVLKTLLPRLQQMLNYTTIECLKLSDTDRLIDLHKKGYQRSVEHAPETFRIVLSQKDLGKLPLFLECVKAGLEKQQIYLLLKQSEFCGVFVIPLGLTLDHFEGIIQQDGDSVSVLTQDEKQGFLLDWNAGDTEETYDISFWGPNWSIQANKCADLFGKATSNWNSS